jgi:hypothetical protein
MMEQIPYRKELEYLKAAIELGAAVWLFRKAATGERLPSSYVWWAAVGATGASLWAFWKAQKMERPEARVLPVADIERTVQSWIPTEAQQTWNPQQPQQPTPQVTT